MKYHQQNKAEVFKHFDSGEHGLSSEEALKRLIKHGKNELREKGKKSALFIFFGQFRDFMILILIAAAVLSGIMGDLTETIIILVIVLLNAIVGFIQEYRAEKAMELLKKMSQTQTRVMRNGNTIHVPSRDLVPGDLVFLEAGNVVPADIRLIETHSLQIDEASLTGESVPVDKIQQSLKDEQLGIGDQINMAFKGTLVTNGRAVALVVNTGMQTELGKIAEMLQGKEGESPLQKRMAKFSKNLSYLILLICSILFVSGYLRGEEPFGLLLLSVSLAVAAIPEALPALITVALSRGASRLARKNALMRKLPAVETLGSVSYICSDKTGTLTMNKMKVEREYLHPCPMLDKNLSMMDLGLLLNQDVEINTELKGDSTEVAMVEHVLLKNKFTKPDLTQFQNLYTRVAEVPFDSQRKCMSTLHRFGKQFLMLSKGASEQIATLLNNKEDAVLLLKQSQQWASEGLRVLGFAYKILNELPESIGIDMENGMTFCGLVAMVDPPRKEAAEAIQLCKTAGIRTVMITGDHPATAGFIARELGILEKHDAVMGGKELLALSDEWFLEKVENISVYARVSPEQKLRIVTALQKKNHFVAMTGDGVNDAPSLKAANIGVAMGITGTDVSKEAAHMILLDDNFSTIVRAVHEGRRIYDNIRKFVKYIMTCNSAEIWTIFMAPLLGLPMPLLPIHILWINLVTDGLPALALVNEKGEADLMQRPPRPSGESLFSGGITFHILWVGLFMAGITLAVQAWALSENMEHWQTMVFTVLSVLQLGHVMGVRSERIFLFKQGLFSNRFMLISLLLTMVLQLMVIYVPFMNVAFKTQPLHPNELGLCILLALVLFHALELEKWIRVRLLKSKAL
jgi:Ca2+-transporting ATPase